MQFLLINRKHRNLTGNRKTRPSQRQRATNLGRALQDTLEWDTQKRARRKRLGLE